jgi:hypothetical protein
MKLYHFTDKPMYFDKHKTYNMSADYYMKPKGLWLSDENDYGWKEWCKDNDFEKSNLECKHEVNINGLKVLLIKDASELITFTSIYKRELVKGCNGIDWKRVAKDYKGIIISPYQWAMRLDDRVSWYYRWDCASGCIWDLSAIESFQEFKMPSMIK